MNPLSTFRRVSLASLLILGCAWRLATSIPAEFELLQRSSRALHRKLSQGTPDERLRYFLRKLYQPYSLLLEHVPETALTVLVAAPTPASRDQLTTLRSLLYPRRFQLANLLAAGEPAGSNEDAVYVLNLEPMPDLNWKQWCEVIDRRGPYRLGRILDRGRR